MRDNAIVPGDKGRLHSLGICGQFDDNAEEAASILQILAEVVIANGDLSFGPVVLIGTGRDRLRKCTMPARLPDGTGNRIERASISANLRVFVAGNGTLFRVTREAITCRTFAITARIIATLSHGLVGIYVRCAIFRSSTC